MITPGVAIITTIAITWQQLQLTTEKSLKSYRYPEACNTANNISRKARRPRRGCRSERASFEAFEYTMEVDVYIMIYATTPNPKPPPKSPPKPARETHPET